MPVYLWNLKVWAANLVWAYLRRVDGLQKKSHFAIDLDLNMCIHSSSVRFPSAQARPAAPLSIGMEHTVHEQDIVPGRMQPQHVHLRVDGPDNNPQHVVSQRFIDSWTPSTDVVVGLVLPTRGSTCAELVFVRSGASTRSDLNRDAPSRAAVWPCRAPPYITGLVTRSRSNSSSARIRRIAPSTIPDSHPPPPSRARSGSLCSTRVPGSELLRTPSGKIYRRRRQMNGVDREHLDIALRYSDGDLPRTSVFPPVRYRVVVAERFLRPRQLMACAPTSHCPRSSRTRARRNGFNDRPQYYRVSVSCAVSFTLTLYAGLQRHTDHQRVNAHRLNRRACARAAPFCPSVVWNHASPRHAPRILVIPRAKRRDRRLVSVCLADEICPGAVARWRVGTDGECCRRWRWAGLGWGWGGTCVIWCGCDGTSPTYTRTSVFFDSIGHRGHLAPSPQMPLSFRLPKDMRVALREYERPYFHLHLPRALRLSHPIAWYPRADTGPLPILDSLPGTPV
ncbi:hypothetical protein DFH08DRAFT_964726 [Mycena albidolilacea]|uniref:Uncharacterized protein n=1 Tax=Mycena albidolilacea TaxID=1033008 RepID=A0AAD6ZTE4_9AGAR|nr:hypothetical protein DFH08DRAFT_964726 [Mycena albidolilacea]